VNVPEWKHGGLVGGVGNSVLAETVWFKRSGSNGLVQTVWFKRSGSSGLVQAVWFKRSGSSGLVQAVWFKRTEQTLCQPIASDLFANGSI